MQEELLPIGKMAALNRVSISTLRLYDEKGLLKPRYTDPQTGYRYYHIDQNARLDMIVYMKELGMRPLPDPGPPWSRRTCPSSRNC